MTNYESILAAAAQLSPAERARLIDDLAATTPDDCPPSLPADWEAELNRRWEEIQSGKVATVPWEQVKKQLFSKVGLDCAD